MKTCITFFAVSFVLLLTGCSIKETTSMNFESFTEVLYSNRRKKIENEPLLDISAFTPDFAHQNNTYTEQEIEILLKDPSNEEFSDEEHTFTLEQMVEDTKSFFTPLQTTYGAYEYFGGDEVFLPIKQAVTDDLPSSASSIDLQFEEILIKHLSPVLIDGHFNIAGTALGSNHQQYMYYVPDFYFNELNGLDSEYIKPTIGPDGAITNCFATMNHDGLDLPKTIGEYTLNWVRADHHEING